MKLNSPHDEHHAFFPKRISGFGQSHNSDSRRCQDSETNGGTGNNSKNSSGFQTIERKRLHDSSNTIDFNFSIPSANNMTRQSTLNNANLNITSLNATPVD